MEIELTASEILMASILGCFRNVQSWKNAEDKHGAETERDGWQINVMGCISEMAWAKYMNKYYNASIGDYDAVDVDKHFQIRSSPIIFKHNACLTLHKKDNSELPYILALVGMSKVIFAGWLWGDEGIKKEYWRDKWKKGRPAYFIEQKHLRSMETIFKNEAHNPQT